MKRLPIKWLLPVALAGLSLPALGQVAFTSCPNDAFITRGAGGANTSLYTLNLASGAMTAQVAPDPDMANVNGIGFRGQDGFIWGWNNAVNQFARVGQNGVTTVLGSSPSGFTTGPDFFVADIQPSTGYYVGHQGGNLYFFNVTTNALVRTVAGVSSLNASTDMAFHPTDGMIYSVNSGGDLFRVNPTTGAATMMAARLLPTNETSGGFGGIFFDGQGTLYAYKSGSTSANGYVYRVFNAGTTTPTYDRLSSTLTATNLDGARCPTAPPQGAPAILLSKLTLGQAGGPFAFQLNNTVQTTGSISTTSAGVAAQVDGDSTRAGTQPFTLLNANLGSPLTITESSLPSGWTIDSARCTLNGALVGSLNTTTRVYTVPGNLIATGNNFVCRFDNRRMQADLAVNKVTQGGTGSVVVGSTITYQVTVTNNGPDAVTGATVTDTPVSGVNCPDSTPVSCTLAGNCPAGPINLGNLKAGITMPTLALNATATFTFSCTVN